MGFTLLYTNQTPVYGIDDERFWLYAPLEAPLPENVIADRTIR
jgi:hypothetical protein